MNMRINPNNENHRINVAAYDKYKACVDQGMTVMQAARHLGMTHQAVRMAAARYGLTFNSRQQTQREKDIAILMAEGGYSADEATRIVDAPKRRVTWRKPE